jgi:hypothetical protein
VWSRGWVEVKHYSSMTAALEEGEWSAARPGRTLPPGKTRYPFYRRLGGPQSRSGRAEKSRPHRDSIPDRPARNQSLYRLSYPALSPMCNVRKCNTRLARQCSVHGRIRTYVARCMQTLCSASGGSFSIIIFSIRLHSFTGARDGAAG